MIRRALARLLLRLIGPELRAEAQRVAASEANYASAVALTISDEKLRAAVTLLGGQDAETLRLMIEAFELRNQQTAAPRHSDALPGERPPARDDAAFEVIPPSKLH